MKKTNKRIVLKAVIGILALLCMVLLLVIAKQKDRKTVEKETKAVSQVTITFDEEDLIYEGKGTLDLMEGVSASDEAGNDKTDQVETILISTQNLGQKTIRYRLFDENGNEVVRERRLVLKGYSGPEITATDPLELKAEELEQLVDVLDEKQQLSAQNGFSMDITKEITWKREKTENEWYQIMFTVRNEFMDSDEITVTAHVEGEVNDPVLELYEKEITLPLGGEWNPFDYIEKADNGRGEALEQVKIEGSVQMGTPGTYSVVYRLDSYDHTAETSAVLRVTVQ